MDSLEIHWDTQYNSPRDSKVVGKKTAFTTVSVVLILIFTGGSQEFYHFKTFYHFLHRSASGSKQSFKDYSVKRLLDALYFTSLPERTNCLISRYIQLKMNKGEQRTFRQDAESSRAQGPSLSHRQGWQSQPQQPAQRACLPGQPYLGCDICNTSSGQGSKVLSQPQGVELMLASLAQHMALCYNASHSSAVSGVISAATPMVLTPGAGSMGGTATQMQGNDSGQTQGKSVLQNMW